MNVVEKAPDVGAGDADIAIQFTEPKQHDVIARRMGTLHYISFASRGYLDEHGEPNSLFEYFRHRAILHQAYVHQIERWAPKMSELRKLVIDWLKDMFEAEDAFWFTEHFVHPNRVDSLKPYLKGDASAGG